MSAVIFDAVNIVFGDNPARALPLMDAGKSRAKINTECAQVLGVMIVRSRLRKAKFWC